jgi:hypothetical protein
MLWLRIHGGRVKSVKRLLESQLSEKSIEAIFGSICDLLSLPQLFQQAAIEINGQRSFRLHRHDVDYQIVCQAQAQNLTFNPNDRRFASADGCELRTFPETHLRQAGNVMRASGQAANNRRFSRFHIRKSGRLVGPLIAGRTR